MFRVNRVINQTRCSIVTSKQLLSYEDKLFPPLLLNTTLKNHPFASSTFTSFGNKQAIEKERAWLADELNRGYFADINELKQPGGKAMVDSWSVPFFEAFRNLKNVHLYEVSLLDSWLLCLSPVKRILLKIMRKSNDGGEHALQRQIVYSFCDHYYFRKELKILNLLTGYIFLLDKFG